MFLGHFALGFGAKRAAPAVSLGTLLLACQLADLVWPNLVLLGVEQLEVEPGNTAYTPLRFVSYPYSHSLVALALWGAALALFCRALRRSGLVAALTLAALVMSHWLLDFVSHRPDMPRTVGSELRVGLGLWETVPATLVVETALFALGVGLYARATRARDGSGRSRLAFWGLVAFLAFVSTANAFGPPPPSATAVAWSAQAMWLIVAWGYSGWIGTGGRGARRESSTPQARDRGSAHRRPRLELGETPELLARAHRARMARTRQGYFAFTLTS